MKIFFALLATLLIGGCSGDQVGEFVFRKTLEYELKEKCGDSNKECTKAVEEQIEYCMKQSDWKRYADSDEDGDEEEMYRFINEFFPCFKDPDGNSYFGQEQEI